MTQRAILQAAFALLVAGCTVNVSNPNIGSKNNVTANADVKTSVGPVPATVGPAPTPPGSPTPTAVPSRPPKPDYAIMEGDVPFVQDEIDIMLASKLLSFDDLHGMSEVDRLKKLKPETRAYIRSKRIERRELVELLANAPDTPRPTPVPTPGPPTTPAPVPATDPVQLPSHSPTPGPSASVPPVPNSSEG